MPKPQKSNSILYVKLASLDDLCRYASNFDYTASNIISVKSSNSHSLIVFGEHLEGAVVAYYINTPSAERMICYTYPSSISQSENSHFVTEMGSPPNHFMNILDIDGKNLKKNTKAPKVPIVKVGSVDELVIAVIRKGIANECFAQMYSFNNGKNTVFCAFDILEELSEGPTTLYYAVSNKNQNAGFARYKYTENKVDFTGYMGEHSYMYAKIIKLAEPFPFFKMPD